MGVDREFGKDRRLLNARDYRRVFDDVQVKASHRHVLLLATPGDSAQHRLGLVIAKKHVRLAVQRNRVKRVAREVFRQLPPSQPALDVVMLARSGIDRLDNAELSSILRQLWRKLLHTTPRPEPGTGP